ncbi:CotY/CotZ family spore coat protein [Virgibacillus xinjiangensis]|uniref:CotY/CotZ family spore coat protein n=1 Tax=Virgibacillus xinjiangensis TaxID=393090 RepID=A0ABV7CUE1_9BACI
MSRCRREHEFYHHYDSHCICDVVKEIVKAQKEIEEDYGSGDCYSSIQQLRGAAHGPRNTTIPFLLYNQGSDKPFKGAGVFRAPMSKRKDHFFGSVESPIFRARKFSDKCCVNLELLLPVTEKCNVLMPDKHHSDNISSYFPTDDRVIDFQATGICITVDLENFTGITCLDPVTPIPADETPESRYSSDKHY